jgi:hypothetical protein
MKGQRKALLRLLRALARSGARLQPPLTSKDGWHVCVDGDAEPHQQNIGEELVEACRRQDLLTQEGRSWQLSDTGRMALRRLLAGAEPFQDQHQQRCRESRKVDGDQCEVTVSSSTSPLAWLARRKDADGQPLLAPALVAAGERLAADFHFAGLQPRIVSSWQGAPVAARARRGGGGAADMSDGRLAARQRLRSALEEVGDELADILLDVCCFETGLGEIEQLRGWPRRSGKIVLQLALERLARHYGLLSRRKTAPEARANVLHWGGEGYRPSIDGG